MAFLLLLRLRRIHTLTTHSPLHHRFLYTSTSGAGAGAGGDPNPKYPFPSSFLREVRETIKLLSTSSSSTTFSFPSSFNFKQPSLNSEPGDDDDSDEEPLEKKLERFRVSSASFRHRYAAVRRVLSELLESRQAFYDEIHKKFSAFWRMFAVAAVPQTPEILDKELHTLIISLMRLEDMTAEDAALSQVLIRSRLDSLEEIVENFSEITEDLQEEEEFGKIWNELNEGKEMQVKDAEFLAMEFNKELAFISQLIKDHSEIRRGISHQISGGDYVPSDGGEQNMLRDSEPKKKPGGSSDEQLQKKLNQLWVTLSVLRDRHSAEGKLLSELKESINALHKRHFIEFTGLVSVPQTRELSGKKLKTLIARCTRLKEITVEGAELAEVLTSSRVDSLQESVESFLVIIKDLSSLDEGFQKIWNKLEEDRLEREEDVKDELLALETELLPPYTPEILGKKLMSLITSLTRLYCMVAEIGDPLAYINRLIEDFPEIEKHYAILEKLWGKLDKWLLMEVDGAKLLLEETDGELAFLSQLIKNLSEIHRQISRPPP